MTLKQILVAVDGELFLLDTVDCLDLVCRCTCTATH